MLAYETVMLTVVLIPAPRDRYSAADLGVHAEGPDNYWLLS